MASNTEDSMTNSSKSKDMIRKELRDRGIQLWKPPYYGVPNTQSAFQDLASTLHQQDGEDATCAETTLSILQDFQQGALSKLRSKNKVVDQLVVRILGASNNHNDDWSIGPSQTWAERVTVSQDEAGRHLTLRQVNPNLTVTEFGHQLARWCCHNAQIRLVSKGTTLVTTTTSSNTTITLVNALLPATQGRATLLCLVQQEPALGGTLATLGMVPNNADALEDEEEAPVGLEAIRCAAAKLRADITDGSGQLVSMTQDNRTAFLTALGMHALGKSKLLQAQEQASVGSDADSQALQQQLYVQALDLLLQADDEWNQLDDSWHTRVDNYGLLQLDVCWLYLKLQRADQLPHAVQRLKRAERTLRQQVHSNFVPLALVNAETGHPVPPVAAIFVRLFVLQGLAHHFQQAQEGHPTEMNEQLDWARLLCTRLRSVSSDDAVTNLIDVLGDDNVSRAQAISALRRCNGLMHPAAELLQNHMSQARCAVEKRQRQRAIGLCENGKDYVQLEKLAQLTSVLSNDDYLAGSLLRLCNNDITAALDMHYTNQATDGDTGEQMLQAQLTSLNHIQASEESNTVAKRQKFDTLKQKKRQLDAQPTQEGDCTETEDSTSNTTSESKDGTLTDVVDIPTVDPMVSLPSATAATVANPVAAVTSPQPVSHQLLVETLAQTLFHQQIAKRRAQAKAERKAIQLLRGALGGEDGPLAGQETVLGSTLDEEWSYLEQYHKQEY